MTKEEFIKKLEAKGYSHDIEGDKIVVVHTGFVDLESLGSLPKGVEFKNKGAVFLNSLKSMGKEIAFTNGWDVNLESLIGGWFGEWEGNIEGINSNRLLNKMIKEGLFER